MMKFPLCKLEQKLLSAIDKVSIAELMKVNELPSYWNTDLNITVVGRVYSSLLPGMSYFCFVHWVLTAFSVGRDTGTHRVAKNLVDEKAWCVAGLFLFCSVETKRFLLRVSSSIQRNRPGRFAEKKGIAARCFLMHYWRAGCVCREDVQAVRNVFPSLLSTPLTLGFYCVGQACSRTKRTTANR